MLNHWLRKFDSADKRKRLQRTGAQIVIDNILRGNTALGICFSEERDLLSQWRGYATDGAGFSISFNKEKIEDAVAKADLGPFPRLCKVHYGDAGDRDISHIIKGLWETFSSDAERYEENDGIGSMNLQFTPEKYKAQRRIVSDLFTVKNGAFSEENEWRILLFDSLSQIKGVEFRESNNLLSPFVKLKIPNDAISSVTIGPANPTPVSVVEAALENAQLKCHVGQSRATYRNK